VHQYWPLTTGQGMTLYLRVLKHLPNARYAVTIQAALKAIQIPRVILKLPVKCCILMLSMNSYNLQPRMLCFSAPAFLHAGILLIMVVLYHQHKILVTPRNLKQPSTYRWAAGKKPTIIQHKTYTEI